MRYITALTLSLAIAPPAMALQHPDGSKNPDHRMCDVAFNPDDVPDVQAIAGDTVTIKFSEKERVAYVSPSDTAHLKYFITEGSNVVWFKATQEMPAQPVSIRTLKEDGTPRDYAIQWTAFAAEKPAPPNVNLASASNAPLVSVEEVAPKRSPYCYVVRYQYPADEKAAKDAAAKAAWFKRKNDATEIALHQQQQSARNVHYVAMGDFSIGPTEVYDDGNTTELHFPGNLRLPTVYTVTPDGQESVAAGVTTEDNGVMKLHGVYPIIRLRQGTLVLCIFDKAYNPIGDNPQTGTTSQNIDRKVHSGR